MKRKHATAPKAKRQVQKGSLISAPKAKRQVQKRSLISAPKVKRQVQKRSLISAPKAKRQVQNNIAIETHEKWTTPHAFFCGNNFVNFKKLGGAINV